MALEKNTPIKINGIPNPSEYANIKFKDSAGVIAAIVRIVPRTGAVHGVHAAANDNPNKNDKGKLDFVFFGMNFFSKFKMRILEDSNMYAPNAIIMIPPI